MCERRGASRCYETSFNSVPIRPPTQKKLCVRFKTD
jgi:hypothetical protein